MLKNFLIRRMGWARVICFFWGGGGGGGLTPPCAPPCAPHVHALSAQCCPMVSGNSLWGAAAYLSCVSVTPTAHNPDPNDRDGIPQSAMAVLHRTRHPLPPPVVLYNSNAASHCLQPSCALFTHLPSAHRARLAWVFSGAPGLPTPALALQAGRVRTMRSGSDLAIPRGARPAATAIRLSPSYLVSYCRAPLSGPLS